MRALAYLSGLAGLACVVALVVHADFGGILHALQLAGWRLLWLIPYRLLFFLLYALGWEALLEPYPAARQVGLSYLFWVTTVREAIDRLAPVASVGGGVAGIRLLRWRGVSAVPATVSVIVEIVLTLAVLYVFTAIGLTLLFAQHGGSADHRKMLLGFLLALPVPAVTALLLRYGSVFSSLQRWLRPVVGDQVWAEGAASLDQELRLAMRRGGSLAISGILQLLALMSASLEIWLVSRWCGHPVSLTTALILESLMQAARHLAFFVPGALGVQEAGLMLVGQTFGISAELALAVSMAKRLREVLCGVPSLLSWQWLEMRRLRSSAG